MSESPQELGLEWVNVEVWGLDHKKERPGRRITAEQLDRIELSAKQAVLGNGLSDEDIKTINRILEEMEQNGLAHRAAFLAGIIKALVERALNSSAETKQPEHTPKKAIETVGTTLTIPEVA